MKQRRKSGQGMIEAVTAAVVLIPLALFLLDFMVLVIANQTNDSLSKAAARAGASQDSEANAHTAVLKSLAAFHPSPIVTDLELHGMDYDKGVPGACVVSTRIKVHFPMPIPGFADLTFAAKSVEPIVNFKPQDVLNP